MDPDPFRAERAYLVRDKYDGDASADLTEDLARLAAGEPLAYVIGWIPFHGLRIGLDSRPLIPRPETEWWTGELVERLRARFGDRPFRLLDLCAGSGAIGLAVLHAFPNARVSFGELYPEHVAQIAANAAANGIDPNRVDARASHLYEAFQVDAGDCSFDVIVTNPPYVPAGRTLEPSLAFEPAEALFAGPDGLDLVRPIVAGAPERLAPDGELWIECDIANAEDAVRLMAASGAVRAELRTDPFGRPRLAVGYYA